MTTNTPQDGGPVAITVGTTAVLVSKQFEYLRDFQWRIGRSGYVYLKGGNTTGKPVLMHRIITRADCTKEVHHINGIKTDNRLENLETLTASEHQKKYHSKALSERNRNSIVYPKTGICRWCGLSYEKNPDHRKRQTCCSKRCAMRLCISVKHAMLAARKEGK